MGPAKLKKAEKLGIRILSEEEFIRMIDGGAPEDAAKSGRNKHLGEGGRGGRAGGSRDPGGCGGR